MYLSVDPKASRFHLALGTYAPVYFLKHLINQSFPFGFSPTPFSAPKNVPVFFTLIGYGTHW